jgi:methylamine utilization protein MauE
MSRERAMAFERAWLRVLAVLLFAYAAASLVHHAHNAEFLADYPNMPAWITRPAVYAAWLCETMLGVAGYLILRRGHLAAGLGLIAVYAALGFDAFAHYALAPAAAHTAAMNATIWLEAAAAALVFVGIVALARRP